MGSEENIFIDALKELLLNKSLSLHNGQTEILNSIHFARLPFGITNNTNIVLVPKGPAFPINQLGSGSRMTARDRYVRVEIYIFHDGLDEETVIKTISDITYFIANTIMDANAQAGRIGKSEWCDIGEISYDWASADEQDENTLAVSSLAVIPITALYRR